MPGKLYPITKIHCNIEIQHYFRSCYVSKQSKQG